MLLLFLAFLAGAVVRFLIQWAFDASFNLKSQVPQFVVVAVVGLAIGWLAGQINLSGWLGYTFLASLGFMSKYGLEWLNKRRG